MSNRDNLDEMSRSPSWGQMIESADALVYDLTLSDSIGSDLLRWVTTPMLGLDSEGSSGNLDGWAAAVADLLPNATSRSLRGKWDTVADDILAPVIGRPPPIGRGSAARFGVI